MVRFYTLVFCLFSLSLFARPIMPADTSYEDAWKLVESYDQKQRPQSALEVVNGIYAKAKREKNTVNFIKAVAYKLRFQQQVKEDDVVNLITDLRKEAVAAPFPERNILYAYLARTYLGYFNSNAYAIEQRTPLAGDIPEDVTLWDGQTFRRAIFATVDSSLKDAAELQKLQISPKYKPLFESYQKNAELITPTLFDGLANNALDIYRQLARSHFFRTEFEITTHYDLDSSVPFAGAFAPVREFVDLQFRAPDTNAQLRIIHLHQHILRFHLNSGNTAALIDADLWRLAYVRSLSSLDENDTSYTEALTRLYEQFKDRPEGMQVVFRLMETYRQNEPQKAYTLGQEALKKHPRSLFSGNVRNLLKDIERIEVNMSVEQTVQPAKPFLALVRYRNIDKLWFRIVETDEEISDVNHEKLFDRLSKLKPIQTWSQSLPDFKDKRNHSTEIKAPALSKKGKYMLLASTDPEFQRTGNNYGLHPFWVTGLVLVKSASNIAEHDANYFVHSAISGAPISGAQVKVFTTRYNYSTSKYDKQLVRSLQTDPNGKFTFVDEPVGGFPKDRRSREGYYYESNYIFDISTSNDRFVSEPTYNYPTPQPVDKFTPQTYFFTDRSIYRPGQTIHFKGIIIENNSAKFDHRVLPNRRTTVKFYDANSQLLSEQELTTNEFGSFSGTFTAPVGKLNGRMHIEDAHGNAWFRVEEYKRPTFDVTFKDVKKSYKVGDSITIKANAVAFSGSNLDRAQVSYRVVRVVYFPYWSHWWRPIPYSREVTIASGTTTTSTDGSFNIGFIARPDPSQAKSNDPIFAYRIIADITDINGETQSGETSVSAAYYSLIGNVLVPKVIERSSGAKLVVETKNINGQPSASRNELKIERLAEPQQPLRMRLWEKSDTTTITRQDFRRDFPFDEYRNESDMNTWGAEEQVLARALTLDTSGIDSISLSGYKPGIYKVTFTTHDPAGKDLKKVEFFKVYDKASGSPSFVTPLTLASEKTTYQPGTTAIFTIASSYNDAVVYYEVTSLRGVIRSEQIKLGKAQRTIEIPVTEQDRGGVGIVAYIVHDYRLYSETLRLDVPWTNKELTIKLESFHSKLKPGAKDEWRLTIKGSKAETVAAEMLAAMYDASLDEIEQHEWSKFTWQSYFPNPSILGISLAPRDIPFITQGEGRYEDYFDYGRYMLQSFGLEHLYNRRQMRMGRGVGKMYDVADEATMGEGGGMMTMKETSAAPPPTANPRAIQTDTAISRKPKKIDQVIARKNFNETAFFYPALRTNDSGEISFSFTIPEALTTWRMMGYTHSKDLKIGYIEQRIVTQKELMVQPNIPRFVREGDTVVLSTKISNISDKNIAGDVKLSFLDATTMQLYAPIAIADQTQKFATTKDQSTSAKWKIVIPEGSPTLVYRIVAASEEFSDGEEAAIPVLPNKMLVTETLPLNIRGKSTETYRFDKLAISNTSSTLRNYKLTLEMSSNPAWYAIQALPMLMEFPYDCSEQIFNRYYANSIAFHLANSSPRIKRVFDSWKGSKDALLSNLEKNEDLKQVLLEETPWVLEGKDETERKRRVGVLFDVNTVSNGLQTAITKLQEQQTPNGGWTWFPGMPESDHITQYIVAGFGKLRVMGIDTKGTNVQQMIETAVRYIDKAMDRRYDEMKKHTKEKDMASNHLGYDVIQYLYARSFFKEIEVADQYQVAFNYWRGQAEKYWTDNTIMAQSMIALALHRFARPKVPKEIVTSLKERALNSKELGMYWKQNSGWFWYELPIETQAVAIELFDEVSKDQKSVEELKIWLLKQKQVSDWKTTTATADACYALLGRGNNLLASTELVKINIGGKELEPRNLPDVVVEEGTGHFRTSWHGEEIKPEMANVTLTKVDDGIAWGGLYWQYFERLDKITPAKTPLMVEKKLYVKSPSAKAFELKEITSRSPIRIGDKVTARIVIRVDRDMEYIHLKDMRGASFEPVSQLSGFRFKDGLGYYESVKDASTNFFVHYLSKGTYVLEYDLRASHSGTFLGGISTIQSMYAPEFASHTEGITVSVKE